jgi:exopolysaccharide production protein ExoZ
MKTQIQVIQLFRGLAALLVCCFHMKGLLPENSFGFVLFKKGSIGVPLFFIISGFIMYVTTYQIEWNFDKIKTFLFKRAVRILPLYYLATFVFILVSYQLHFYIIEHPKLLLPTIFFYPTYANLIGPSYGMPALKVGWSLNYEVYFYLLLAFSFMFKKYRWYFFSSIIIITLIIIPVLTRGYVMQDLRQWYTFHFSYFSLITNPVILFFVLGLLIGKLYKSTINFNRIIWANLFVIASLINFAGYYFDLFHFFSGFFTHLFNCGLLILSTLLRDKLKPYKIPKFLVFLGDISFSLYLVHPIILFSLPIVLRQAGFTIPLNGWIYFCSCLLVIILMSSITYQIVEKILSKLLLQIFMKKQ